jgi:hypothetical protein
MRDAGMQEKVRNRLPDSERLDHLSWHQGKVIKKAG